MGLQANNHMKLAVEKTPPRKSISDTINVQTENQTIDVEPQNKLILDVMAAVEAGDPILIVDGKVKNLNKTSKYLLDMLADD